MRTVVALFAVLGIVMIGSQLMLLVPAGRSSSVVAVLRFLVAAWSGRYIVRRARR